VPLFTGDLMTWRMRLGQFARTNAGGTMRARQCGRDNAGGTMRAGSRHRTTRSDQRKPPPSKSYAFDLFAGCGTNWLLLIVTGFDRLLTSITNGWDNWVKCYVLPEKSVVNTKCRSGGIFLPLNEFHALFSLVTTRHEWTTVWSELMICQTPFKRFHSFTRLCLFEPNRSKNRNTQSGPDDRQSPSPDKLWPNPLFFVPSPKEWFRMQKHPPHQRNGVSNSCAIVILIIFSRLIISDKPKSAIRGNKFSSRRILENIEWISCAIVGISLLCERPFGLRRGRWD
jgi:hypothetical protein